MLASGCGAMSWRLPISCNSIYKRMTYRILTLATTALLLWNCNAPAPAPDQVAKAQVSVSGAMRNVMWKGELGGTIQLDTISAREHLYALGPVSYLRGEIMAVDGKVYVSRVTTDTSMAVELSPDVSAPFLVFADVKAWQEITLPPTVKSIQELEALLDQATKEQPRPFAFKLEGTVSKAQIHVQNLPKGATVSSPEEAHRGQVKFPVGQEEATIVGFFSTEHQGVFTHHDTYLHMHLITGDRALMGHLDELTIENMKLYVSH